MGAQGKTTITTIEKLLSYAPLLQADEETWKGS